MHDRSAMINRLLCNRDSRESYIRSKLNVLIPSQLRALRLNSGMTQEELGHAADMKQSRISAMERPGDAQFNTDTLVRLAAALKVALLVRFVPFGEMLRWENSFSQDTFKVTPINEDREFITPAARNRIDADATISVALGSKAMSNVAASVVTFSPTDSQLPRFMMQREGLIEAISGYTRQGAGAH